MTKPPKKPQMPSRLDAIGAEDWNAWLAHPCTRIHADKQVARHYAMLCEQAEMVAKNDIPGAQRIVGGLQEITAIIADLKGKIEPPTQAIAYPEATEVEDDFVDPALRKGSAYV